MKTKVLFLIAVLSGFVPLIAQEAITQSVVKIFVSYSDYNYDDPWNMQSQYSGTGSDCIIAGNKILTNAHVVSNSTFIQVMKAGAATKFIAHVEAISHASDLAILKVDDPLFFQDSIPIPIGELPKSRDKVVVYGFPTGGDEMSVTKGVVSIIEKTMYTHSGYYLRRRDMQEKGFIESFNGMFRDECLSMNYFLSLEGMRGILKKWRIQHFKTAQSIRRLYTG